MAALLKTNWPNHTSETSSMIEELSFLLKADPFVPFTIRTSDESFEFQRSTVARLSQNSLFLDAGTQH